MSLLRRKVGDVARALRRAFDVNPRATRLLFGVLLGTCLPLAMVGACSDDRVRTPILGGGSLAGGPGIPDPCATPNEGCACDIEGETLDCGRIREQFDDYVTCQMGTRTCTDGAWSACTGDRITVKSTAAGTPGLDTQGLGAAQVCPKTDAGSSEIDPCDPYCNVTPDTPGGFDAGSNFSNTDAGLTLIATSDAGVPCTTLTLAPTPATVSTGNIVTVTGFGPPPVTSPTGPVRFNVGYGPTGCSTPLPFPMTWTINQVDRAQITGTNSANGALTVAVPIAGPIQVTVYALGTSATTTVNVKVNVVETPTGAPNSPATAAQISSFGAWNTPAGGTTPAGVTWLYPYADTFFPLALPPPVIQYWYTNTGGGGSTASLQDRAVKVSLRYPVNTSSNPTAMAYSDFNYSIIVRESNVVSQTAAVALDSRNPQVLIPAAAWQYFEQTARGQNADLLVQRVRASVVEQESRRRIRFVDGQLKGTVYYNSYTSPLAGNTGAVLRINPGATAPTVAVQPTSTSTSSGTRRCTVCHSLNLDGTRLIANGRRPSGGVTFNNSQLFDTSDATDPPYGVPVLENYNAAGGIDTENVPGNRYTFGGPRTNGALYMTHGGTADPNWRSPPANSNLYSPDDPTTSIALTGWPTNMQAVTPRFSPAGDKLAFGFWAGNALSRSPSGTLASASAGTRLTVVDFACGTPPCNGTGEGISNARDLTPGVTERVAWPSFLPNGSAVVYQRQYRTSRSSANGGVLSGGWSPSHINTVAGALAELWMSVVPATSATAAVPTRLNQLNGLNSAGTSYLPEDTRTVAAFSTTYHQTEGASFTITQADNCGNTGTADDVFDHQLNYLPYVSPVQAGGFSWVVFTSRRMYGSIARNDPWDAEPTFSCTSGDPQTKKLWVAAIDNTVTPGTDPSHPAFYLPGQELTAGNSDGIWVSSPCVDLNGACSSDDDCCFATGASPTRECKVTSSATVPPTRLCQNISSCSAAGAACTTTANCCAGLSCPMGGGVCVLVPPPPVTVYTTQSTTREYIANCPRGTQVKWRFFEWQATVPTSTSIGFTAQVKATAAAAYTPATPLAVSTALPASGTGPGIWYRGPQTIDQVLQNAMPPLPSGQNYLRITMTFNPSMTASPTLHEWRQIFDCVPAE
jgi:hypothetical protein